MSGQNSFLNNFGDALQTAADTLAPEQAILRENRQNLIAAQKEQKRKKLLNIIALKQLISPKTAADINRQILQLPKGGAMLAFPTGKETFKPRSAIVKGFENVPNIDEFLKSDIGRSLVKKAVDRSFLPELAKPVSESQQKLNLANAAKLAADAIAIGKGNEAVPDELKKQFGITNPDMTFNQLKTILPELVKSQANQEATFDKDIEKTADKIFGKIKDISPQQAKERLRFISNEKQNARGKETVIKESSLQKSTVTKLEKDTIDLGESLGMLESLAPDFRSEFFSVAGTTKSGAQFVGEFLSPGTFSSDFLVKKSNFIKSAFTFFNKLKKIISGVAVPPMERADILKAIPNVESDVASTFESGLRKSIANYRALIKWKRAIRELGEKKAGKLSDYIKAEQLIPIKIGTGPPRPVRIQVNQQKPEQSAHQAIQDKIDNLIKTYPVERIKKDLIEKGFNPEDFNYGKSVR